MKRAWVVFGLLFIFAGIAVTSACSDQGEGERCDALNGDDDCSQSQNLACYRANELSNSASDRCCPRDRTQASVAVCQTPVSSITGDSSAPADTGPAPTTSDDGSATTQDSGDASDGAPQ